MVTRPTDQFSVAPSDTLFSAQKRGLNKLKLTIIGKICCNFVAGRFQMSLDMILVAINT